MTTVKSVPERRAICLCSRLSPYQPSPMVVGVPAYSVTVVPSATAISGRLSIADALRISMIPDSQIKPKTLLTFRQGCKPESDSVPSTRVEKVKTEGRSFEDVGVSELEDTISPCKDGFRGKLCRRNLGKLVSSEA